MTFASSGRCRAALTSASAVLRQAGDIASGAILQHELKAARRTQAENRRQAEGEGKRFRNGRDTAPARGRGSPGFASPSLWRSSHGFSVAISVATFEFEVPVAISRPPSTKYVSTPGSLPMISSILRTAASVRSVEAPSGSRIDTKNAPWSSFGRKPAGRLRNRSARHHDECDQRHAARALTAASGIRRPTYTCGSSNRSPG